MLAIKTENLTKKYGNRAAVNNLNLSIEKGEIFSLLGTNGAGKTTSINMLCGLVQESSGKAYVNDLLVKDNKRKVKEIIGVSPQETAIANHLTTKENLMLMGGVSGLKRSDSRSKAKHLMDLLELEDRKDQVRRLSGGMQRRLSIAMALMSDPKILFLDEPTLGLDPHARKSVWRYIEKLKNSKTILLTTHYLEEADALADTIAIMDMGSIVEIGSSNSLKKKYTNEQTLRVFGENINQNSIKSLLERNLDVNLIKNGLEIKILEKDVYVIMELLKGQNIHITSLQMKEPTLDDIFLKLTEKGEQK